LITSSFPLLISFPGLFLTAFGECFGALGDLIIPGQTTVLLKIIIMKKLLILLALFPAATISAQLPEGINNEHLVVYPHSKQEIKIKRIVLKTGVELEYIEQGAGNGIPVIFLHGLSDSWHSFEFAFKHLEIHAIAFSQRGHGNSGKPSKGYQPKDFSADVAAFMEQRGLKQAVIVGHSMGGVNAVQFAIDHPSMTKALVIIDSDPTIGKNRGMPEFLTAVQEMKGDVISYPFMLEFQRSTLAKPIDSTWFNLLIAEGLKCPIPVFKEALKGLVTTDLSPGLKKLRMPVLIFWGDEDMICFREGQERLKQAIMHATSIIYEGTGHALHWEEPQRFATDLSKFIDGLPK
jgi:non-heme chloroperoxidase